MKKRAVFLLLLISAALLCFVGCKEEHVHTYSSWSTIAEATCTKTGVLTRSCTGCGNIENSIVDALGHKVVDIAEKASTCQQAGSTSGKQCSVCNEYIIAPTVKEKLAHTETDLAGTAATCGSEGLTDGKKCSVCDEILLQQTSIPKLAHTETDVAGTAATCDSEGLTDGKKCSVCGEILLQQITLPKLAHSEKIISATDATCTADGLTQGIKCSLCGKVLTSQQSIPAKGHNYKEEITRQASCVQTGIKTYTCTVCKSTKTEEFELPKYTGSQIYDMVKNSVGVIYTYTKGGQSFAMGTGFVLSEDGNIVTSYHIIEHAFSADIVLAGTTYSIDKVLAYDPHADLAVVKINATGLTPIKVCSEAVPTGSTVFAFGNPKGYVATFSQGSVTHSSRKIDDIICIQHDAALSSGNSGGPLINEYCEVIGINTWTRPDGQNLNFAVTTDKISQLDYSRSMTVEEVYYKDHDDAYGELCSYVEEHGEKNDIYIDIYDDYDQFSYNLYIDTEDDVLCVGTMVYFDNGDIYAFALSLHLKSEDYQGSAYYSFANGEIIYSYFTISAYEVNEHYTVTLDAIDDPQYSSDMIEMHSLTIKSVADWLSYYLYENTDLSAADFGFVWY